MQEPGIVLVQQVGVDKVVDEHGECRLFGIFRGVAGVQQDEALRQQISTDPHSPEEFRCNQVVRNVPAFYAAFDVQPTDAAWLDPSDRVKIW